MSTFIEDLWKSVFAAGPTPTLLVATNVTFAALELVLVALLFLTYSIHFLILSVLAGALWGGINWFVAEVRYAQAEEEKLLKGHIDPKTDVPAIDPDGAGDRLSSNDDGDTEVEDDVVKPRTRAKKASAPPSQASSQVLAASKSQSSGTRLTPETMADSIRQRSQRQSMAESTGSLSTDSEWEKIEGEQ